MEQTADYGHVLLVYVHAHLLHTPEAANPDCELGVKGTRADEQALKERGLANSIGAGNEVDTVKIGETESRKPSKMRH